MNPFGNTFRTLAMQHLTSNGMFDDQAMGVIRQAESDDDSMRGRWDDQVSGYPDVMQTVFRILINSYAVKWIDANKPEAWYRPIFAGE